MFNQRPNSLLGLEPGCNTASGELMNLLSPIIYSPDEYFRNYLSQFSAHDVAVVQQQALASPLIQRSIQQAVQQHLNSPQAQLQVNQLQLSHHQSLPVHQQQHQQNQQQQQQQQQPPPLQSAKTTTTHASQYLQPTQSSNRNHHNHQQQQQHQVVEVERPSSLPAASRSIKAGTLTDEERLRNKRERNRRAAANCRRRKDERLKQLEDENEKLRKTMLSFLENLDKEIDQQAGPMTLKAIIQRLRGSIGEQIIKNE